jgi:hypothetical protein
MVGDPSLAPLTLAYASIAGRGMTLRTSYGYNRTRFAPGSVRRLRGGGYSPRIADIPGWSVRDLQRSEDPGPDRVRG